MLFRSNLYAFKWQSYTTWISGAVLLMVTYWLGGGGMLVESGSRLTHGAAVAVSAGVLVGAWLVYDAACRSPLMKRPTLLATLLSVVLVGLVYGLTHVFGARAAWIQTGATIATIMAANVLTVIVPGQKAMLAQTQAGLPVDTSHGVRAKVRSTHNHYLTLPVLFMMLSTHFPSGYGHPQSWLVLLLMTTFGVVLKYVMNARTRSDWRAVTVGVLALAAAIVMTARPGHGGTAHASAAAFDVSDDQVMGIVARRHGIVLKGASAVVEKHMNAQPRRIGRLPVTVKVPGTFTADQKKLLENAAHSCPVHKSLHPDIDAAITIEWLG